MNAIVALIIANIIWGAAGPIFKYSLTNIPPFTLAFFRFFFASLIFLPFILEKFVMPSRRDLLMIILGSLFGITINIAFFFLGLQRAESITLPVIASASPLFLFLLSVIFLREKPQQKVLLGMLLSFIGVLYIIFSPIIFGGQKIQQSGEFIGNMFYIVAVLGSVVAPLLWKKPLDRIPVNVVTFISFMFAAMTFFPFMVVELQTWSFEQLSLAGWVGILFGVFLSSAAAYFLYNYGISKIKVQEVGVFTYIDPVIALLIAAPLLHEYPDAAFVIGSILIFVGIYISEGRIPYHPFKRAFTRKNK